MKKILFAISPSVEQGGAQKVFFLTVRELSKMNCELTVILPDNTLFSGLKQYNVNIRVVNFHSVKSPLIIHQIIKEGNFDLINTYLPKGSLLISIVNLFHRIPMCCTLLNAIIHVKIGRLKRVVYPFLYYALFKLCDGFIVNSEQNKQHFMDTAGINGDFIKVIYSGIDIKEFITVPVQAVAKNKFTIGFVGRLSIEKGPACLIAALKNLKGVDYECLIVGDGPIRSELEGYVSKNNLDGKVKFLGFQNEIAKVMHLMDVVVVPSLNETFGLTVIEAFALKKAVIASNVGGIPELVSDKRTGLLFQANDDLALSERISYIYNNKGKAKGMGENGYNLLMRDFTMTTMAENTLNYFNSLMLKS
jgi:glycosyltransferase involved in cell wall biosynthesis